jgi:SNF2 family DNA or RNA helicase
MQGKIPIALISPASAGHGLNLQKGGHILIWFSLCWSLEMRQQTDARLNRQGQTEVVTIHNIVTKDTIDEDVLKALENKNTTQENLIQGCKGTSQINDNQSKATMPIRGTLFLNRRRAYEESKISAVIPMRISPMPSSFRRRRLCSSS